MGKDYYISFMSSIAGYHNPQKHTGWTRDQFLQSYINFLEESKMPQHKKILSWINENEEHLWAVCNFVQKNFNKTLIDSVDE